MAIVIVGVMATIAVPSYRRLLCSAKETEVRTSLAAVVVAQKAYRTEYDSFAQDTPGCTCPGCADCTFSDAIMAGLIKGKTKYNYTCFEADPEGFTVAADARNLSGVSGTWTVNHLKNIQPAMPVEGCY